MFLSALALEGHGMLARAGILRDARRKTFPYIWCGETYVALGHVAMVLSGEAKKAELHCGQGLSFINQERIKYLYKYPPLLSLSF